MCNVILLYYRQAAQLQMSCRAAAFHGCKAGCSADKSAAVAWLSQLSDSWKGT